MGKVKAITVFELYEALDDAEKDVFNSFFTPKPKTTTIQKPHNIAIAKIEHEILTEHIKKYKNTQGQNVTNQVS